MIKTNKILKKDSNHFNLRQFVWLGFNYTVGIAFIGNLAILSNSSSADNSKGLNPDGISLHVLWIFLLMGIVASICAFAFAKLSRFHNSDSNGGSYLYTRSALGRFPGILVAVMQYLMIPFTLAQQIFNMLRACFSPSWAGMAPGSKDFPWWTDWTHSLGNWSNLVLDSAGILLVGVFSVAVFFGIKFYKRVANVTSYVKWGTAVFLLIVAIALAMAPINSGNFSNWAAQTHGISMPIFVKVFNSCFFFYTGFEVFSTMGKNIESPEKNVGRGIIIVMSFSVIFYLVTMLIFFCAIMPKDGFWQNTSLGIWTLFEGSKHFGWLFYVGPIIMIFGVIAMRLNVGIQSALYGATILEPLAVEGYISRRFNVLNKQNIPVKAAIMNLIVCAGTVFLWLIIPDVIQGISNNKNEIFDVTTIIAANDVIVIFIYIMVLISTLAFGINRLIKLNAFEWIFYPLIVALLSLMFIYHYYSLIEAATLGGNGIVQCAVEISFVAVYTITAIIWYFTYYRRVYDRRMKQNPKIQIELNYEFRILDNWIYIKSKLIGRTETLLRHQSTQGYDKKVNHFMKWSQNLVIKHLLCNENIEKHNIKKGFDVAKEAAANNRDVIKTLKDARELVRRSTKYVIPPYYDLLANH